MKQKLSMLLFLVIAVGCITMGLAACNSNSGLEYTLSDDGTYYSVGSDGTIVKNKITEIVIPSTYKGLPVSAIEEHGFATCVTLKSVTIPESITSIGTKAFHQCSGLTELNYNATEVETILNQANVFAQAGSKDGMTVNIGANVKSIPHGLFRVANDTAPNVTSVVFEEGSVCESIGNYAFEYCLMTSVTIPDSVKTIGEQAFCYCTALTSMYIGSGLNSIGSRAFEGCTALTSIYYNGTVDDWNSIEMYYTYNSTKYDAHETPSNPTYYGAALYFYSATEPDYASGYDYWYYDADGGFAIWKETK